MTKAFKVGEERIASLGPALAASIREHFVFFLAIPAFVPLFWIAQGLRGGQVTLPEFFALPITVVWISGLTALMIGIVVFRAILYHRDLWFRFENGGITFWRAATPDKVWRSIRYDEVTFLVISDRGQVHLRFRKGGQAGAGLDAVVRMGVKSRKEQDEIKDLIRNNCPNSKLMKISRWGGVTRSEQWD